MAPTKSQIGEIIHQVTGLTIRWSATLSSIKSQLASHAINYSALCGANLVTLPSRFGGKQTHDVTVWHVSGTKRTQSGVRKHSGSETGSYSSLIDFCLTQL